MSLMLLQSWGWATATAVLWTKFTFVWSKELPSYVPTCQLVLNLIQDVSVQLHADAVNGHTKSFMFSSTLPLVDPRTVTSSDSSRPPFHNFPRQLPGYTKSRLRSSGSGMIIIFGSGTSADIYFTHYVCNICCKATSVKILKLHCITFAFPLKYVPQSSKYDSLSKIYRFSGLERRAWTKDRAFTHNLSSHRCETLSGWWNGPCSKFEAMLKQTKQERSFQGFVKVKKWVLAHSHILSCCLSVSPSAIASFHSLAHILTHILVRHFQARWI